MLNKYIEELVKTSSAKEKLDGHLAKLAAQARAEAEQEYFLKHATAGELAKLAGITLPEHVCTTCGGQMEKLGSIFQCACGTVKKAAIAGSIASAGREVAQSAANVMGRGAAARAARMAPPAQTAAQKAAPLFTGQGGGALTANELSAVQGPGQKAMNAVRSGIGSLKQRLAPAPELKEALASAHVKEATIPGAITGYFAQGDPDATPRSGFWRGAGGGLLGGIAGAVPGIVMGNRAVANVGSLAGDIAGGYLAGRTAKATPEEMKAYLKKKKASVEKTASVAVFMKALDVTGGDAEAALSCLEQEGYTKLAFSPGQAVQAVKNWGQLAAYGAKRGGAAVADKARQVGQTYQTAAKAGGGGFGGAMKGVGEVVKQHPGVAAGAAGTVGTGAGYMMGKQGAAERLLEVGDAAGRLLAKTAEGLDPEEVAEAIENAREREDVEGRSRNWGIAGGLLGGAGGGGLGYGAARLLSANPWIRGGAAGLGALAGGIGGSMIGSREGEEEAQADRMVSFLRGRNAFNTGAQSGYGQGLQHGYMAGMAGGQGGEEDPQ